MSVYLQDYILFTLRLICNEDFWHVLYVSFHRPDVLSVVFDVLSETVYTQTIVITSCSCCSLTATSVENEETYAKYYTYTQKANLTTTQ